MNIRNVGIFQGSFWDWSPFNDCFEGSIRISDIDGVVERKGHFLYIETKKAGTPITTGQRIMHDAWIKKGDSVLVIWGEHNQPQAAEIRWPGGRRGFNPCDQNRLRWIFQRWFEQANK